jgi:hypothetical protein
MTVAVEIHHVELALVEVDGDAEIDRLRRPERERAATGLRAGRIRWFRAGNRPRRVGRLGGRRRGSIVTTAGDDDPYQNANVTTARS